MSVKYGKFYLLTVSWIAVVFFVLLSVLFSDLYYLKISEYAFQRYCLVVLIGLSSIFSLFFLPRREVVSIWPVFLVSAGFVVLGFAYYGHAFVLTEPVMFSLYFLGFVMVGSVFQVLGFRHQAVSFLSIMVGGLVSLYGISSLTVYIFILFDNVLDIHKYIPWGFVNIRYWSHIATWLLPILPLAILVGPLKNERLWQFFVALGAALWWWVVFLSTSRGTMVSVAFGVLLVVALMGRPAFPWLKVFVRYLAYGVVAWFILSVLIPSVFLDDVSLRQIKSDTSGRMPLFIEAWQMSLVNFPFGMGPQSWLTHEVITEAYRHSKKFGHPHNMYLMWAAEYGWLLIAAMLPLVGQAIVRFWKRRCEIQAMSTTEGRQIQAVSLAAFAASVSAALVHAGASAVFMAPGSMLIGFLVLSIFWALISPSVDTPSSSSWGRRVLAISVAGGAGLLWGLWFGEVLDYYHAMEKDLEYYQENNLGGMLPRFWFHGNFPRAGQ